MILPLYVRQALDAFFDEYSRILVKEDQRNFKRGTDLKLVQGERLILRSANGAQYALVAGEDGSLSLTPATATGTQVRVTTSPVELTYTRAASRPGMRIE